MLSYVVITYAYCSIAAGQYSVWSKAVCTPTWIDSWIGKQDWQIPGWLLALPQMLEC